MLATNHCIQMYLSLCLNVVVLWCNAHDYMGACISTAQGINVDTSSCLALSFTLVLPHTITCRDLILSTFHPIRLLNAGLYWNSIRTSMTSLRVSQWWFCYVVVVAVVILNYNIILIRLDKANWAGHFLTFQ